MLRNKFIKRVMDVCGAIAGLIILSPLFLVISIMVCLTMGRPVFFRQTRPGLNREPFDIYKFRTMKDAVDASGKPLSDELRLTWFGNMMRSLSLDEIPQLINVLRGEMSIVGPRPLLYDFFPYYSENEMRRHEVKPGVTGLAQVSGRNNLNWDTRLKMDVEYVDSWNILADIKIILKTVWIVLKRDGVRTEGYATFLRLDDYRRGQQEAQSLKKTAN